jgi:phage terminase small subunit
MPRPPRWLSPQARAAWRVAAPKLGPEFGVIWALDRFAFAVLCTTWVEYVMAHRECQRARCRHRPAWVQLRDTLHRQARRYGAKFLLIPEARVRLAPLAADGLDVELRRLFTPGEAVRPVPLSPDARRNLEAWCRRAAEAERPWSDPRYPA